jgi:two-component system nitrogen regulation response regulator GlnG
VKRVLIVDDEEAVCWSLQRALQREGYQADVAATAEQALVQVGKIAYDAIVLDVRLPGLDGLAALGEIQKRRPGTPVIIATAFGSLSIAVRAVEQGAFDYLAKPFDLTQALDVISRATRPESLPGDPPVSGTEASLEEIVGRGSAMQAVFKRIALVAPTDACVLITGESGTGKELVARAIHRYSTRKAGPYLPVHIAALNPNLTESELFGHARGAFTGANVAREGLLSLAAGGTVFLDEVADIPLGVQVKLLRVLEHQEVLPVGGNEAQPLSVRVLAATHQDLGKCVAEGHFRHDLYFRLNVFQITLPPLRERPEDIEPLAEHFLRRFAPQSLPLLPATVRYLQGQPWFGNVRELRNALEHAAIIARGRPLTPEHFPPVSRPPGASEPVDVLTTAVRTWLAEQIRLAGNEPPHDLYERLLDTIEAPLLAEIIRRVQGNRWEAARWLGLNRATVRKKLAKYGLAGAQEEEEEGETAAH